jgi:large subunit ribosomal protein L25
MPLCGSDDPPPTDLEMSKTTTLKAAPRLRSGSGKLKQMRREGWLPSVVYGRGVENENLKVDAKTFSEHALHVDFLAVNDKTEITANIPVHLTGESNGVKAGGILEQYAHTIEIVCFPKDLPESIEMDISHLNDGDSLHIGDLSLPAGVKATHAAEVVVAHIGKPAALVSEESSGGGEAGAVPATQQKDEQAPA